MALKNRFSLTFAFLILFAVAAFERFYRLKFIGLDGSDVFFYWDMAKQYLEGHYPLSEHYRPLAYALYALAMSAGGVNFYSIKYLNSGIDLLNGVLIALIAFRLTRQPWLAWVSAGLYFALTEPVLQSRSELLHIPSTLPFLLAFFLFTQALRATSTPWLKWISVLTFSGFSLGLAANIHPTVALMAPGFVFALWWWSATREPRQRLKRAMASTVSLSLGFSLPFLLISLTMGAGNVGGSLATNRGAQTQGLDHFGPNFLWGLKSFVPENTSLLFGLTAAVIIGIVLWRGRLRRRPFAWTAILWILFSYALLYIMLVPKYRLARTFLPLIPLLLIFVVYFLTDLLRHCSALQKRAALLVFALTTVISFRQSLAWPYLVSWNQQASVYLEIQKTLSPLQSNERLLVTPLIADHHRAPLAQNAYFGAQAGYLIHQPLEPLNRILKPFTFVIYLKEKWDLRTMTQAELNVRSFRKRAPLYFSLDPEHYSAQVELSEWRQRLPEQGYQLMMENERFVIWRKP